MPSRQNVALFPCQGREIKAAGRVGHRPAIPIPGEGADATRHTGRSAPRFARVRPVVGLEVAPGLRVSGRCDRRSGPFARADGGESDVV